MIFHKGMDLAADSLNVYASASGTVTYCQNYGSGGNIIVITHANNKKTAYMHLTSFGVSLNESVTEGQIIGVSGATGGNYSPHLHFEYREYANDNWYRVHPEAVLPYNNIDNVVIEPIITTHKRMKVQLSVPADELDIDYMFIDVNYYETFTDYWSEPWFLVDYSYEHNIPISDGASGETSNSIALGNTQYPGVTYFELVVTPESLCSNDENQVINYEIRVKESEPDIYIDIVRFEIRNAVNDIIGQADVYEGTGNEDNSSEIVPPSLNNFPNPFNPTTTINYNLGAKVVNPKIEIFNIKGQKVNSFELEEKSGKNSVIWNGTDQQAKKVSSGVYFYRLQNNNHTIETKKMLMLK